MFFYCVLLCMQHAHVHPSWLRLRRTVQGLVVLLRLWPSAASTFSLAGGGWGVTAGSLCDALMSDVEEAR